jgi:hypothetical protein
MTIVPIRNFGQFGVISDRSAFLLPINAHTAARNIRYDGDRITSGPAWRTYRASLAVTATPVLAYGTSAADGGFDQIILCDYAGSVSLVTPSAEVDVTPVGEVQSVSDDPWTACSLSGVHYLNRSDRPPFKLTAGASVLTDLDNWPSGVLCRTLRNYGARLIAINCTESGVEFPTRVRFSEAAQNGAEPVTWDAADDAHTAGFTDLEEVRGELLDGWQLGQDFMLYGPLDVYRMTFTGSELVMDFRPVWNDFGVFGTNCVAQVGQEHVVFGRDDIVIHNGVDRRSLVDGKVRRRIYDNLDLSNPAKFFVVHDKVNREVLFCYRSIADDCYWNGTDWCNEAAVWSYVSDTWSFRDLPNVGVAATANVDTGTTWDTLEAANTSWDGLEGAWNAGQGSGARGLVFPAIAGQFQSTSVALMIDGFGPDNRASLPLYAPFAPRGYAERSYLSLDGLGVNLRDYKRLKTIYPLVSTEEVTVLGQVGSALYPSQAIRWSRIGQLDSTRGYKIDHMTGGRYLAYRIIFVGQNYFEFAGADVDIVTKGRR